MENPEFVTGIPLLILAAIGLFIAVSLFAIPSEAEGVRLPRLLAEHAEHPEPSQYVVVGITLGFITAVEVALYYVTQLNFHALVVFLIFLSLAKFMIVVGFFMHLRFDNKIFSMLFFGGLVLAIAVFTVAITTLKAGLV